MDRIVKPILQNVYWLSKKYFLLNDKIICAYFYIHNINPLPASFTFKCNPKVTLLLQTFYSYFM